MGDLKTPKGHFEINWPLKCPECKFDTKKETLFEKHATKRHPLSYTFFGKIEFIKEVLDSGVQIKEEPKLEQDHIEIDGTDHIVLNEPLSDIVYTEEQGNLLKGVENKTVRRLHPFFTYVLISVIHSNIRKQNCKNTIINIILNKTTNFWNYVPMDQNLM